uniref:Syntaxin N-terminal domain-containing protein n=1 Tax=Strigamia maritima TaxID=126957 RepID=T1JDD8_STRMM
MSVRDGKRSRERGSGTTRRSLLGRKLSRSSVEHTSSAGTRDEHSERDCAKFINDMNIQLASLRDLLIHVGQPRDCPEMREKIRKVRKNCVDSCKATNQILLPQVRSDVAEGIPVDNQHFVHLFCLAQLLVRELYKCKRLVTAHPIDMTQYLETKPGPSGMCVLNQLVLCNPFAPDFTDEEIHSIDRDTQEIGSIITEMQEFMPREENGKNQAFIEETVIRWQRRRRKRTLYKSMGAFCCLCRPNYL